MGGLPGFREELQRLCIGIASHRAKRFQHRLIKHSKVCHAKSGSWLGDDNVLVTHFGSSAHADVKTNAKPVAKVSPKTHTIIRTHFIEI